MLLKKHGSNDYFTNHFIAKQQGIGDISFLGANSPDIYLSLDPVSY